MKLGMGYTKFFIGVLFVIVCLPILNCKKSVNSTDELEGYVKLNYADPQQPNASVPDKFYFEWNFQYLQEANSWDHCNTIVIQDSSVWEYKTKSSIEGSVKLWVSPNDTLSVDKSLIFDNQGTDWKVYIIGFRRNVKYDFYTNNMSTKRGICKFIFTKLPTKYGNAQYKL